MKIFDSYIDAGQELPQREKEAFYAAILEYLHYGREPELKGAAKAVLTAIMPSLEASRASIENGRRGGRPRMNPGETKGRTQTKPSENLDKTQGITQTKPKPEPKPNLKGIDKGRGSKKEKPPKGGKKKEVPSKDEIPYAEIVSHLNAKTGSSYRTGSEKTRQHIRARWAEGYRLPDFEAVIDNKVADWLNDPGMAQYLRPETLFGTKFDGYLNQPKAQPKSASAMLGGYPIEEW